MNKGKIYELAIMYKQNVEQQSVPFKNARAVRDVFKPILTAAVEIEEDIKKIPEDKREVEIPILLSEVCQIDFNASGLLDLLDCYTLSAGMIDLIENSN